MHGRRPGAFPAAHPRPPAAAAGSERGHSAQRGAGGARSKIVLQKELTGLLMGDV